MTDDVLKGFWVSLGYKVDEASESKFRDGVAKAEKALVSLGAAAVAVSSAIAAATIKIAGQFDELYYSSQRIGTSAKNLEALRYAFDQVGSSSAAASSAAESFGAKMRTNPGIGSYVRSLGVLTEQGGKARDTIEVLLDAVDAIRKKHPYYVGAQVAGILGISEEQFNTFEKYGRQIRGGIEEYGRAAKSVGLDVDDAAKRSAEFDRSLRSLWLTFTVVAEKVFTDLEPALKALVDQVRAWLAAHPQEIENGILAIGTAARQVALWITDDKHGLVPALKEVMSVLKELYSLMILVTPAFQGLGLGIKAIGWLRSGGDNGGVPGVGHDGGTPAAGSAGGNIVTRTLRRIGGALGIGSASAEGSPPVGAGTGAGHVASKAERAAFIRQEAAKRGINPDYALRVAQSEGFNVFAGDPDATKTPTSFGDFQLHYAGRGAGMGGKGVGDAFTRDTGLDARDPKNWREADRYALDQVVKGGWGPWHGAARIGITGRQGISTDAKPQGWQVTEEEKTTAARAAIGVMVFGDSIAARLRSVAPGKIGGVGVERISSSQILKNIMDGPREELKGKHIILASGSNSPDDMESVRKSLAYLRASGPASITLMGAGDRPNIAGLNSRLQGIAREAGVNFMPLGPLDAERIHPTNPRQLLSDTLSRIPSLSPQSTIPPGTVDNSSSSSRDVTLNQKTDIHVHGSGDVMATANEVARHQGRVGNLNLRDAQGAIR